jgi:hypothetical protein
MESSAVELRSGALKCTDIANFAVLTSARDGRTVSNQTPMGSSNPFVNHRSGLNGGPLGRQPHLATARAPLLYCSAASRVSNVAHRSLGRSLFVMRIWKP